MVVHSPSKPTATPWPALLPMGALAGKPPIPIARPATLVGSRQTANLRLHSSQVSKAHALILSSDSKVYIRDLNSRTKVIVNGKEVRDAELKEGDQLKIGRFTFRFTAGPKIQSSARRRALPPGQLETEAGDVISLNQRVIVIGQRSGCDLVIPGETVSTTHAAIYDVNGRRYIMDLGSRNGTYVNGQKTIQVELKIGDVIEIGGTDVRYVGAAGMAEAPAPARAATPARPTPAKAEAATLPPPDADLDELLALESLGEAPEPPKPSGESKIFAPGAAPEDSNAPIPMEDELQLPEPVKKDVPAPPVEMEPEVAAQPVEDSAAQKAAEDELMALLDNELDKVEPEAKQEIAPPAPSPEPVAEEVLIPVEEEAIAPPVVEEEQPIAVEQEVVEEAPPAVDEEPIAVDKEPIEEAPVASEEESIGVEAEAVNEPPIAAQEEPVAVEPELVEEPPVVPEEEPEPVAIEPATEPELQVEPMAIEEESPVVPEEVPEPVAIEPAPEPEPQVEPMAIQEEPLPMSPQEEMPQPAEAIATEQQEEIQPAAAEAEAIPLEMEIAQEVALQPELPIDPEAEVIQEQPQEIEVAAASQEPTEEVEPEPTIAEVEPPAVATTQADLIPQPTQEVAEEVQQAAAAFEADDLPALAPVEEMKAPDESHAVETPAVDEQEELLEMAQAETVSSEPPPPPAQVPEEPQQAAPAPEAQFSTQPIAQKPPAAAPPKPRWITTVQEPAKLLAPKVVTIKRPHVPSDFDLDEFLGSAKTEPPAPAPVPAAVVPPPPPAPAVVPPPVIEAVKEEPQAAVEEPDAVPASEPPPIAASEPEPDLDDLAMLALEEAAPMPQPATEPAPEARVEPELPAEDVAATPITEAPPSLATTSNQIVPEPADSVTSTFALPEEEELLEAVPDEPVSDQVDSYSAPVTMGSAAATEVEAAPADFADIAAEPAAPDAFSIGQPKPAPAPPSPAHRGLGSPGRIPPRSRVAPPIPPRWGPLPAAVASDVIPSHPTSRRTRKKLSVLLVLMLIAMVVAAVVVWKIVLPRVVVLGTIHYDGVGRLRREQQDSLQKAQLELLDDAKVRAVAEGLFRSKQPRAAGFFVEQDFRHPQLKRQWVASGDRSDLQITYQGSDPTLDADRLYCVLQAIYDANSSQVAAAASASKTVEQKRLAVISAKAELGQVRDRRLNLESIRRPDPSELAGVQSDVHKLDDAWTVALSRRKAIAADVDRLSQPTETAANDAAPDGDSSLKLMSEKLTALNGRLAEAKSAAAKQAADARTALNSSISDFQTSLGVVQGMMKDNPALASYISSAQKLHEASWKLQGDLIERQEQQQAKLLEFKKRLEEQVEVRKREVLESDPDLKELTHLLEGKAKEVNALSASGGLRRDVDRLRGEMQYIEGRITSRKAALSEDKFYSDAIGQVKQIIDSAQKQLDADRAASEKLMNDLETKFRNTSPEIETLPAAQRSLAARLGGQVDKMQAARKAYTEAVQAQDADANNRLKKLQEQAASLESEIALRRNQVAAEEQKKLTYQQAGDLKKKQAEMAEAEKAERVARDAYRQKINELEELVKLDRDYQSTREELQRIIQVDEPVKQDQVTAAERAYATAQRAADTAVAPQMPEQPKIDAMQDYRALYSTGAVLVVGLVFGALIFFSLHSETRHRAAANETLMTSQL